jgi:hypothetical protein
MTQAALLNQLENDLRAVLEDVRTHLSSLSEQALNQRPDELSWNALECFAHVNVYLDFYLPRIELAIHKAKARRWVNSGGEEVRYTGRGARAVRRASADKKYKTGKKYNFIHQPLSAAVIKRFLINSEMLLRSLQGAREVNINKPTVRKLNGWTASYNLGNLMEYLVLHSRRHVAQAKHAANRPN